MSNKKQTAVMAMANAFREWQKEWDSYKGTNQPKSFDEFIEPFLQMEKQQIKNAYNSWPYTKDINDNGDFKLLSAEQYYNEIFKSE